MAKDKRLLKSYVWYGSLCFFVSTIERDSSAMVSPPRRYFETVAWEFDWEGNARGEQVAMAGSGEPAAQHFEIVRQLFKTGKYVDSE